MINVVKEYVEKEQVVVRVNVDGKFKRRLVLVTDGQGLLNVDETVYTYFEKEERPSLKKQLLRLMDIHNEMQYSASLLDMQREVKEQEERTIQLMKERTEKEEHEREMIEKLLIRQEEAPLSLQDIKDYDLQLKKKLQAFPYQAIAIANGSQLPQLLYINHRKLIPTNVTTFYQLRYHGEVVGLFLDKKEALRMIPVSQLANLFEIETLNLAYQFFPAWSEIYKKIDGIN